MQKQDINSRLQALKLEYLSRLPTTVDHLKALWAKLTQETECNNRSDVLRELYRASHSLKGSGATFGYPAISETAKGLEIFFASMTESSTYFSDAAQHQLNHLFARLDENCAKIIQQLNTNQEAPLDTFLPLETTSSTTVEQHDNHILIATNDEPILTEIADYLQQFGYNIKTCGTVQQFESMLDKQFPMLIIMDVDFPEESGTALMTRLRQEKDVEFPPTIFISAYSDIVCRLDAVRAQGAAFLEKPICPHRLFKTIDRLLDQCNDTPYRVFILDDDEFLLSYFKLLFSQSGMISATSQDPIKALSEIKRFMPDLILLDMYMPGCSGIEFAQVLRQDEFYLSTPIVYLSGEQDKEKALSAMSVGADEFLNKPVDPRHLIASVSYRIERARKLRTQMSTDSLTGLSNHTTIQLQLENELARAKRAGETLSFVMIDLDHFKSINDTYGHPTGDRVISNLSRILKQRFRSSDLIGRYGGEEFAVILPNANLENAIKILEEIRTKFEKLPQHSEEGIFYVTFSCGIASFPDYEDPISLLTATDQALYRAKRNGRNQIAINQNSVPTVDEQPTNRESDTAEV